MTFEPNRNFALQLDKDDPLAKMRDQFHIPKQDDGSDEIYLCGNSLGLQPKKTAEYISQELSHWQKYGVKGHFSGDFPWMPYHEFLTQQAAQLVGANPEEVVVMNSLTVNLHLMMTTFYRPTKERYKILIESHAFPSDHYAVCSQLNLHGYTEEQGLLLMKPQEGEELLSTDDILAQIEQHKDELALILLPGVQYYTGQLLEIEKITKFAKQFGIYVGVDLAHATGNVPLSLHDWQVDFACWCHYKYCNSGPGAVGGCFIHEKHATNTQLPRMAGWWGHDKQSRFKMDNHFLPIATAEGWQLSNPPILSLVAIRASFDTFSEAGGIKPLREKSLKLTGFLEYLLTESLSEHINIITPQDSSQRGCQLSLTVEQGKVTGKELFNRLEKAGVTCDWREPNVIRIAPVPLYNRYIDVYDFVEILKENML